MPVHLVSTRKRPAGLVVALGGFVVLTAFGNVGSVTPVAAQAPAGGGVYIGRTGCLANGCHGEANLEPPPAAADVWRSSGTYFEKNDPHNEAYRALSKPLAKQIIERLNRVAAPGAVKYDADPKQAVQCLACHTNPGLAEAKTNPLREDGISCETCHGPAKDWQVDHQKFREMPAKRDAEYDRVHMTRLYDIGVRADTCVGCHVGAPADPARGYPVRDMNHDMIAAGHPRLNFDLAAYKRKANTHWTEKPRRENNNELPAGYDSQRWLVGRLTQAEAAVRLHADRATRTGGMKEFADLNCFSCHHSLEGGWRSDAVGYYTGRVPGTTYWNSTVLSLQPGALTEGELAAYRKFTANPTSGPAATEAAAALAAARKRVLDAGKIDTAVALKYVDLPSPVLARLDWDQTQELAYAYRVFFNELGERKKNVDAPTDAAVKKLLEELPLMRKNEARERFDSPKDFTPGKFAPLLRDIQDRLRTIAGQ